jgi:hypothetical protein
METSQTFIITYEVFLTVTKVWEERSHKIQKESLCLMETSFHIREQHGEVRNVRIYELLVRTRRDVSTA